MQAVLLLWKVFILNTDIICFHLNDGVVLPCLSKYFEEQVQLGGQIVKIGGVEQFEILIIQYAVYIKTGNHSQRFPNSTTPRVDRDYVHRNKLED